MRFDGWTFLLQAINFLILAWLLQRFLYKPVQGVIAKRQAEVDQARAEAEHAKAAAEQSKQELDVRLAALGREREQALAQAHERAEAERKELLQRAQREADAMRDTARERLAAERREAASALHGEAARLGVEIGRRLLEASGTEGATLGLVERACAALQALPSAERDALLEPGDGRRRMQVVTATDLGEAQRQRCRARLQGLLGDGLEIAFSTDPALLAGVELHFPHSVLRHSWRSGLDDVLKELLRDGNAA